MLGYFLLFGRKKIVDKRIDVEVSLVFWKNERDYLAHEEHFTYQFKDR
jgi:hypothetical protein